MTYLSKKNKGHRKYSCVFQYLNIKTKPHKDSDMCLRASTMCLTTWGKMLLDMQMARKKRSSTCWQHLVVSQRLYIDKSALSLADVLDSS